MNKQKKEFAQGMLIEALEMIGFPEGMFEASSIPYVRKPDKLSIVVLKDGMELVAADCMVLGEGKNICGTIMMELINPYRRFDFFSKGGRLYAHGEEGNV